MFFEIVGGIVGGSPIALTTMYVRVYTDELARSERIEGLSKEEAHMNATAVATASVWRFLWTAPA